jgi:hypothetical protein
MIVAEGSVADRRFVRWAAERIRWERRMVALRPARRGGDAC